MKKRSLETEAIHFGEKFGERGSMNVPIYQNSTFRQKIPGTWEEYTYTRTNNPTEEALRQSIAHLENGARAVIFSSGLAAINGLVELLEQGDQIVSMADIYGGTYRLFEQFVAKRGIDISFVDTSVLENVSRAITPRTKLIYLETPSNPLLRISDIPEIAKIAQSSGALFAVDGTMATPYFQRPLDLGADFVVHSTSKYLSGHTNVIGGALVMKDGAHYDRLKFIRKATGANPGPFDCYLTMLGLKTLALRMRQHEASALQIAQYLKSHKKVKHVYYPGLADHEHHELAKRQMSGFGGVLSFELAMPESKAEQAASRFIDSLELFLLSISFGSVVSLVDYPAKMSHKDTPREERIKHGFSDSLIRLSVGAENVNELIEDLEAALAKV